MLGGGHLVEGVAGKVTGVPSLLKLESVQSRIGAPGQPQRFAPLGAPEAQSSSARPAACPWAAGYSAVKCDEPDRTIPGHTTFGWTPLIWTYQKSRFLYRRSAAPPHKATSRRALSIQNNSGLSQGLANTSALPWLCSLSPLLPVLITNFRLDGSARECRSALKLAALVAVVMGTSRRRSRRALSRMVARHGGSNSVSPARRR
jgi:hypothetical protein